MKRQEELLKNKKAKTAEADKNSDYNKPADFDGDFGSIEALAKNMFENDVQIPSLPSQR